MRFCTTIEFLCYYEPISSEYEHTNSSNALSVYIDHNAINLLVAFKLFRIYIYVAYLTYFITSSSSNVNKTNV